MNLNSVKHKLYSCVLTFQLSLAHIIRAILKQISSGPESDWALGPNEVAGLCRSIHRVLKKSKIFEVTSHPFYEPRKRVPLLFKTAFRILKMATLLFMGPYYLARISLQFNGAIYVGNLGYLVSRVDQREKEFRFLRHYGRKLVCVLTGSDIRSVSSMLKDAAESGRENIATYLAQVAPKLATELHEKIIKKRCSVINQYADLIFTSPFDQKSYLREDSKILTPFLSAEKFRRDTEKFCEPDKLIVVHAPSSPAIKGTPLVRSAVDRLKREGFEFKYVELQGVANSEVIDHLRTAHVVLNEFYAFVPGVFGIEGLANTCVVLTRASHVHDSSIPGDPKEAWIPTEPDEVYDHLLWVLQNPAKLATIATAGYSWALDYAHETSGGRRFAEDIEELLASGSGPR